MQPPESCQESKSLFGITDKYHNFIPFEDRFEIYQLEKSHRSIIYTAYPSRDGIYPLITKDQAVKICLENSHASPTFIVTNHKSPSGMRHPDIFVDSHVGLSKEQLPSETIDELAGIIGDKEIATNIISGLTHNIRYTMYPVSYFTESSILQYAAIIERPYPDEDKPFNIIIAMGPILPYDQHITIPQE